MKLITVLLILALGSCVPVVPSTSSTNNQTLGTNSLEAQAKSLTQQMTQVLSLDQIQSEKIMVINVVNVKIMKKLRETNDALGQSKTKEKYKSEIKEVLSESQYSKFLQEFSN